MAAADAAAWRSVITARAAARWEEVDGLATLLGSAKTGAGFETLPLRDVMR